MSDEQNTEEKGAVERNITDADAEAIAAAMKRDQGAKSQAETDAEATLRAIQENTGRKSVPIPGFLGGRR